MRTGSLISKSIIIVQSCALISCAHIGTGSMWGSNAGTSANSRVEQGEIRSASTSGEDSIPGSSQQSAENSVKNSILLSDQTNSMFIRQEMNLTEDRFVIQSGGDEPVLNVLTLSSPPRLVVDLLGVKGAASKELSPSDDSSVTSIRLGSHSDKLRIVFDLKSEEAASAHSIDSTEGQIVVSIPIAAESKDQRIASLSDSLRGASPVGAMAQMAQEESAEVEIVTEDTSIAEETFEIATDESDIDSSTYDIRVAKSKALDTMPTLESIDFKKSSESSGEVKLDLTDEAAFDLKQTSQSEYVLTLPGVKASESVLNPLVSLKGKDGIRSVRVSEVDDITSVRMFIDPGISLTALPRGTTILVRATEAVNANSSAARAQLGDASTKKVDDSFAQANPTGIKSSDGSKSYTGRLISLDLQDTDIDNALRIIAEVSNLNIIASDDVAGKVTLRLIDVPWDQALDVILKTNGLDQVTEGNVIRIAPLDKLRQEREALRESKRAAENLEDLSVNYVRISYARAEDIRPKIEAVLSERGTVTADERTNQLIVKDIKSGQVAAIDLLKKLDLRTPQVLLETQIVEGSRTILRDLGFQWNFSYVQSPGTGNATGLNFPNTVSTGGATSDATGAPWAVNFPAVLSGAEGTAVSAILDSADGSRLLGARLSALESEGRIHVVSRPQVATINNKQAIIRSETTVRVRMPGIGGTTVATGQGSQAGFGGALAFQEFRVGISLEVTPQASPDYYVLLDVNAMSSTFTGEETDRIPNTREREATSTILVKSGQTFALGGVYRIDDQDTVTGVPFLKDIPFFGHMFRNTGLEKSDEELIFFITPHIIEGSFDASAM